MNSLESTLEVGLAAVGEKPLSRLMIYFSGFFRVDRQLELVHSSPASATAGVAGTVPSSPATASRQASRRDMEPSEGRGPRAGGTVPAEAHRDDARRSRGWAAPRGG